jgi:hypothetical protein
MARTWLSIRVDLIEGRGDQNWPRPGRIFAAARSAAGTTTTASHLRPGTRGSPIFRPHWGPDSQ